MSDTDPKPLEGVRVIELGHWVAGPAAGAVMADWGADVIKVESPAGDPMRLMFQPLPGADHSASFSAVNRGKRSLTVDLATDSGRKVLTQLLAAADVFLSNLRPSALERLGLGPETIAALHPRLVFCSVTAYGWDGPDRERAGYDLAGFYGRAGVLHQLTPPGSTPVPYMNGIGDMFTAMSAVAGILAALNERHRTGRGGFIEASLLRSGMWSMAGEVSLAANRGTTHPAPDRAESSMPLFNVYQAGDGAWFVLVGVEVERHLPAIFTATGNADLLADERFCNARAIRHHRRELIAVLDASFATRPMGEWQAIFEEHDVWWGPIQDLEAVSKDPQAEAAGAWTELGRGGERTVEAPIRFGRQMRKFAKSAPLVGEHTAELLAELSDDTDRGNDE